MPDATEEFNRSVREGRIESRHSIKRMEGMELRSHDLGPELRIHSLTIDCDTFSNEEKVSVDVSGTSAELEVKSYEAMFDLSFVILLLCVMKRLGRSTLG